jgi:probable F420-dependent oxidoreductase
MEVIASWPARMDLKGVAGWAQQAEQLGFDVIHVPESIHDPFTVAALALANTTSITVRTSMVVAFARSPMLTAYAAWDLAKLSDGRFQLGLASQVRGNIVGRFSAEWSEPVARLRDYIGAVRAIFHSFQTGADLSYLGAHYTFDRLQPYFNPGPISTPPPSIWTGGVGIGMCKLAGETSDGFVCHPTNSHPRVLREILLPAIAEGRARADRHGVGPALVAGPQPITAATPSDVSKARETRRAELAFLYSTPAYRPQLELLGLDELGHTLSAMAKSGDWSDLARHLSDEVIAQLLPEGTYDEIPAVLSEWYGDLCDGIVFAVAEDATSDAFGDMVQRCKTIPGRAGSA